MLGHFGDTDERDALHEFIDELDDDLVVPALHAAVDRLPDELVGTALRRMQLLRARLSDPSVLPGS